MSINPAGDPRFEFDKADRIRRALRIAEVGAGDLAEALQVSRRTVSNWLNGHNSPRKRDLMGIAMRTGFPFKWLETGEGPSDDGPSGKLLHLDSNQEPIGSKSSGESNVLRVQFGRRAEDEMQRAA